MNRKEIREAIFDEADWAPDESSEAVTRVNGFINRAYIQVAMEAPFLVFEQTQRLFTQADALPAGDSDTIQMVTPDPDHIVAVQNPWVFRTTLEVGDAAATVWAVDRSWDGRKIEIIDDDGVRHQNTIQSIWNQTVDGNEYTYISLQNPWPSSVYGAGPFAWRVYTPDYYLPDNIIEVRNARVRSPDAPWDDIELIDQAEASRRGMTDDDGDSGGGIPQFMHRRDHFQLPSINTAPESVVNSLYTSNELYEWVGPEPVGEFEYCVTLAWGKRDHVLQSPGIALWYGGNDAYEEDSAESATLPTEWAKNRMREPLFESAPSPVVAITVPAPAETGDKAPAVLLRVPNIEYMLGTMLTGTSNSTAFRRISTSHSGWHVRIYRRRISADFTNYSDFETKLVGAAVAGLRMLDIRDDFYLLAEMRIDEFNAGVYIDNGTVLPDLRKPLRDIHGYAGIRLWPAPDERYEIELRTVSRPEKLASDQDVPRLQPDAMPLLINKVLVTLYKHLKDFQAAASAEAEYERQLKTLKNRYGSLRPGTLPRYRTLARSTKQPYYVMTIPRR